jgi:hypothetical protein
VNARRTLIDAARRDGGDASSDSTTTERSWVDAVVESPLWLRDS